MSCSEGLESEFEIFNGVELSVYSDSVKSSVTESLVFGNFSCREEVFGGFEFSQRITENGFLVLSENVSPIGSSLSTSEDKGEWSISGKDGRLVGWFDPGVGCSKLLGKGLFESLASMTGGELGGELLEMVIDNLCFTGSSRF